MLGSGSRRNVSGNLRRRVENSIKVFVVVVECRAVSDASTCGLGGWSGVKVGRIECCVQYGRIIVSTEADLILGIENRYSKIPPHQSESLSCYDQLHHQSTANRSGKLVILCPGRI